MLQKDKDWWWQRDKAPSMIVEHILDPDWDSYEVGSSFIVEEPFQQKKKKKYPHDGMIYWDIDLVTEKGKK